MVCPLVKIPDTTPQDAYVICLHPSSFKRLNIAYRSVFDKLATLYLCLLSYPVIGVDGSFGNVITIHVKKCKALLSLFSNMVSVGLHIEWIRVRSSDSRNNFVVYLFNFITEKN